jgi:hypothetical protein
MQDELTGSELGRRLAAQRRIVEGECVICGNRFEGTRKKRFCSHRCAQKDHWRRKRNIHSSLPADNPYMRPGDRAMDKVILLPDTAPSPQASSTHTPESMEEAS